MTSYDGNAITYDAVGNPTSYNGYTYTWMQGRLLSNITGNGLTTSYIYNDQGIRIQKAVNGVTTKYFIDGDNITVDFNLKINYLKLRIDVMRNMY